LDENSIAFFHRSGDWLVGNDAARGPWSEDACHAGPVSGILAGAAEALVPEKQLVRLSANFFRPIPISGFRCDSDLIRSGRTTSIAKVELVDRNARVCASANCLFLATELNEFPTAAIPHPSFDTSITGRFPLEETRHGKPMFGDFIDIRYPPGEDGDPGPTTLWMRVPSIVSGEESSKFQSLCPLADCGNGISRNAEFTNISCLNPDLTVAIFRLPESDWIASQAISFWEHTGIGMSHAMLFDNSGPIGTALQSLVLRTAKQS